MKKLNNSCSSCTKISIWAFLPFLTIFLIVFMITATNAFAQEELGYSEILYSIDIGKDRYFIHFNACAGDQTLESPTILLESELETVQINSAKIIHANSCQDYEYQISTKSPDLIKITVME